MSFKLSAILQSAGFIFAALACGVPGPAQVNVLTYQYSNARLGLNSGETILTQANVNAKQFGKLFVYPVDGMVYAQPLYMPGLHIPGKGIHNVVFVATEHDSVYAFDADSNAGPNATPLWSVNFLNPAAGVTTVPYQDVQCSQIVPEIGITSTPVIDPRTGTLYTVAMTKETEGGSVSYVQRLHVLDVTTGAERQGSPVVITASVPGTGDGGNTVTFDPKNYKQRPGLLLLNGVVYTAWSSHCDIGVYHGWIIGYDAQTLQQVAVYNDTPNGAQGSFWASGAAPAADQAGNIYAVSGNGTFDGDSGGPDLGDSYIKLSFANGLHVVDYFTPFNQQDLSTRDADVGSAGVALLPDEAGSAAHPHLMVGAGKEGRVYLLDRDNLGKFHAGSDSQIVQSLPGAVGGLFGNPAYFSKTVYFCGAWDNLKAFSITNGALSPGPASISPEQFSYPGCVPAISSSAGSNGILWALGAGNTLFAYDASNLANELYNSDQNSARDALGGYVKFSVPTVANGKVYAGTPNSLAVYGLLQGSGGLAVTNAASGVQGTAAPGSIISVWGVGLAQSIAAASEYPLPTTLAGSSITIGNLAAPLFYASPGQINAQVPFEIPAGPVTVAVNVGSNTAGTGSLIVQPSAPGIFLLDQGRAAALNQDYAVNSDNAPAAAGSVVAVYATGLGFVDNPVSTGAKAPDTQFSRTVAAVSAMVGGMSAPVLFAGLAPGFAGLYQVNIQLPQLPPGDYPLQITTPDGTSNSATISVR